MSDLYDKPSLHELSHHGIQGQKWGVRRGKNYPLDPSQYSSAEKKANGISGGSGNNHSKSKSNRTNPVTKKPVEKMSDAELERRLKRLKQEDEYNRLTKGSNYGSDFVKKTGDKIASKIITDVAVEIGKGVVITLLAGTVVGKFLKRK